MKREEAKALLESRRDLIKSDYPEIDDYREALDMAIKALEQEPCEDAISRDAAIDLIADFELSMDEVVRGIHALPPVTPLPIHNAIIIPNNATNGDVIKAMFPYAIKSNYIESSLDMKDYVSIDLGDYEMRVSYDWWNAPYKPESEEKE